MTDYCESVNKILRTGIDLTIRFIKFHVTFARTYVREVKKEIKNLQEKSEK